ncbi:NFX1-type zinc finger-containing protein 1-like isoform X2 [Pieris napi]|uniref:NFX1-type zinc finger-containing protein 1-like isoform X2 n=1 Tax=Pieris napi TaxID=78633 RepID=UPI001FBA0D18|nr:NFX1-type zinc finger-containing protein 1-like isoform X2 [Pieris napi]
MTDGNKSLRIDWFDGTVIEETRPSSSQFADEEEVAISKPQKALDIERKPIGFKRLLDISFMKPPSLNVELANRPGFWLLFSSELKDDYIVLIVKILAALYKSLERGEKTKVSYLLKTKFLESTFLAQLHDYLAKLPLVRIVEKRLNMQFWDDVESFYNNVYELFQGIFNYRDYSNEFLSLLNDLIETAESSAIGVQEEHSERIGEHYYTKILELKEQILLSISQGDETIITKNKKLDINSFRNISIFPTKEDLLGDPLVNIQPNIIHGTYSNVEHYLDVQFRLLREDCFGPLRDGISKYLQNPNKRRHENIRVYPKVRIISTYLSANKVGYLVDIAWSERNSQKSVDCTKYGFNKQLMFGSLLLFTSDNFNNILCASVLDVNPGLLRQDYIAVAFEGPLSQNIFSQKLLMVESEVFFEPYHRVLKVLQNCKPDEFPMKNYIVDIQPNTNPPSYLTPDTIYSIQSKNSEIYFPVLDNSQWPTSDSFDLDQSQMEAYNFALTKEFAVIQGPPGTGKTFLGVKIASTILKNLSLDGTPMLIICYTNHALDQFLEGILNITDNIVRLGSQSKIKLLESYTLHNLRSKRKSKYGYLYASKRSEMEKVFNEMMEIQTDIDKCGKELLCYETIRPFLNLELKSCDEDPILAWLFGNEKLAVDEVDDWDKECEVSGTETVETCFSEHWALKEIDSMKNSIKYVEDITDESMDRQKMIEKFQLQIEKIHQRLDCFKKYMERQNEGRKIKFELIKDLYSLSIDERWDVYFYVVDLLKNKLTKKMKELLDKHNGLATELEEVSTLIDSDVMKTVRVVGVTTTFAARRHDLMRKLFSPIVIVEEAAEVLEAHIVASLTTRCQHLILIGDHKQLRPSAAHYKLAKFYNLEISLFERMIKNTIHSKTLITQRRMCPKFVELLVPTIYDKLDSHSSVYGYNNVRGMKDNLYFFSHSVYEDSELSKKHQLLRDVRITVVDNYQGEESRIVILSLVRSNRDGNIGFLSAANRICVALSRAKEGFYIFGNINVLSTASSIWQGIHKKLVSLNAIGQAFVVQCSSHGQICKIESPQAFHDCLKGACLKHCP